jgi:hypothetical protein
MSFIYIYMYGMYTHASMTHIFCMCQPQAQTGPDPGLGCPGPTRDWAAPLVRPVSLLPSRGRTDKTQLDLYLLD